MKTVQLYKIILHEIEPGKDGGTKHTVVIGLPSGDGGLDLTAKPLSPEKVQAAIVEFVESALAPGSSGREILVEQVVYGGGAFIAGGGGDA